MKRALIIGVTGQDEAYLAELLLRKGYEVHGIKRPTSLFNTARVDHLYEDPHQMGRSLHPPLRRSDRFQQPDPYRPRLEHSRTGCTGLSGTRLRMRACLRYPKPDGTPRKLLDVSRIRSLGWNAQTSLEQGIRSTFLSAQDQLTSSASQLC